MCSVGIKTDFFLKQCCRNRYRYFLSTFASKAALQLQNKLEGGALVERIEIKT